MTKEKKLSFSKNQVADYEKKRYRGLDQKLVHNREEKILKKIFDRIGKTSGLALDIPCGYGRFSDFLIERGFGLINCDISHAMVKRANERAVKFDKGEDKGAVADATSGLPFKEIIFSLVFSIRLFHHVHNSQDRRKILDEYCRVTSGWAVLSYYQSNALHKIQRKFRRRIKKTPTRIKMITRQKFQSEAEESGFEIVSIFPLFRGIHSQHLALLKKARTRT